MGQQYKKDVDGDLWIPGSITVLGGINSSAYRQTVTRIATTEEDITTVQADVVEVEGDIDAIEEDIIELRDGVENAAMKLSLSAELLKRRRDDKIFPSSVVCASRKQDGTGYSGRFSIDVSPDGESYYASYSSPAPELFTTYTVPAKVTVGPADFYIASIRFRLYSSDGGTLYAEKVIPVSLEAIALYWGARTSPPSP